MNASAPGWVIGWIRRCIAGRSGVEEKIVGTEEEAGRDDECCE